MTERSPIRSVNIRVIIRFVNHESDYRPNWTTRSRLITTELIIKITISDKE